MASHENISRTFIGTVVCVDLVGYSKRSVDQQNAIKEHFNKLLSQVLAGIRPEDRIILDTGDGVAISFLGDPGESLDAGLALQRVLGSSAARLGADDGSGPVRIGINLGPVRVAIDMNGHPNIIGDGINVATCIMEFAKPGQIAVSRSFHDVLSRMSEAHAALFRFEGVHTDANVREHEVYVVRESTPESRRAANAGTASPASPTRATGAIVSLLRDPVKVGVATGLLLAVIGAEALMLARRYREPVPAPVAAVAHPSPAEVPSPAGDPLVAARATVPPETTRAVAGKSDSPSTVPASASTAAPPAVPTAAPTATPTANPAASRLTPSAKEPAKSRAEASPKSERKPDEAPVERPAPPPVPAAAQPRREEPSPKSPRVEPPANPTAFVVERLTPNFPREAINQGISSGTVSARLHIDAAGGVQDVQIRESQPARIFDREAVRALRQWRFNAGADNRTYDVEITFRH